MKSEETIRLFEGDPYLRRFEARVVDRTESEGISYVTLDRTAFYPTSGGQPCDHGTLNGLSVSDVTETDGRIVHRVEGELTEPLVEGEIDWFRRFDHMQQHTGQHMLSQAFFRVVGAMTVGFHLGESYCSIDLAELTTSDELIHRIEAVANRIVFEDRPVNCREVKRDKIDTFPLRKPPAVAGDIRVVEIDDFDHVACCGTHVGRTGEVGLIKVLKHERYKGGARIAFVCGGRALEDYEKKTIILREACGHLTVGEQDLPQSVVRLKEENKQLLRETAHLRSAVIQSEAAALLEGALRLGNWRVVKKTYTDRDSEELKALSKAFCQMESVIGLIGLKSETGLLFLSCSSDIEIDLGRILRTILDQIEGKGGGQPSYAQGRCGDPEVVESALEMALRHIESQLES